MEPAKKISRKRGKLRQPNGGSQSECSSSNCLPFVTGAKRFAVLFNNENMADFHFSVGEEDSRIKVPAHKLVLGASSPVFHALFYGPLATKDAEVHVPDVEPAAFLQLLQFIYTGEETLDGQSVMSIWYAAKKYAVTALETQCVEFLEYSIDKKSAFLILSQARMFDAPELEAKCLEYIDKNAVAIVMAGTCDDLDYKTLCSFLERDTLLITEFSLFMALIKWGKAICHRASVEINRTNMRLVLGRALHLIRYPLMTIKEFTFVASKCGILTAIETVEIFLYLNSNPKPPVRFSTEPRGYKNVSYEVSRFQGREAAWQYLGYTDMIGVRASQSIYIVGVGFYGAIQGVATYTIALKIQLKDTQEVIGSTQATYTCKEGEITFRVDFQEPVCVASDVDFIVSTVIWGPESFFGECGQSCVTVCVPGFLVKFQFSSVNANDNRQTNVNLGQIPIIYFRI